MKKTILFLIFKQVNLLEPLSYEESEEDAPEELEVQGNTDIEEGDVQLDDDGQITLSLE